MTRKQTTIRLPAELKDQLQQEAEGKSAALCLTEKDLNCMARILQSLFLTDEAEMDPFFGCQYCKFNRECFSDDSGNKLISNYGMITLRQHLEKATGLYLGLMRLSPTERNFTIDAQTVNEIKKSCPLMRNFDIESGS